MPESTEQGTVPASDEQSGANSPTSIEDSGREQSLSPAALDSADAEVAVQGVEPEPAELSDAESSNASAESANLESGPAAGNAEPASATAGADESDGAGSDGAGSDGDESDGAGSDGAQSASADSVRASSTEEQAPVSGEALLVQEGEIAGDYLEQLLDILDYDGDIDLDVEGSRAIVAIVGADDLDPLVGARGVTLDALQELTRLTVAQQTGVRTRMMLDVGGYRAGRRAELSDLAATSVARVIENGEIVRMSPMNAFERKIVHDVVTATDGVRSESEGEDPDRRVVILPDR